MVGTAQSRCGYSSVI